MTKYRKLIVVLAALFAVAILVKAVPSMAGTNKSHLETNIDRFTMDTHSWLMQGNCDRALASLEYAKEEDTKYRGFRDADYSYIGMVHAYEGRYRSQCITNKQ